MRRRRLSILVIALSSGWFAASASANLLTNGDFTQICSVAGESQDTIPCGWGLDGPATVSNMTVISQSSALLPSGLAAPPSYSGNYVAFAGGGGGQDCLDEFISTTPGDTYTVNFYAALVGPNPSNAFLTFQWDANGNSNQTVSQFDSSSTDTSCTGQPCFNHYSYTFTSSVNDTGSTRIYFHGADLDAGAGSGNAGNFVLVAGADIEQATAPEPTSLLLTGSGLAIVGCLRFLAFDSHCLRPVT
jgi:hypothetical protein